MSRKAENTPKAIGKLVSKKEFAQIVGKSPRTITTWEGAGMPSIRAGSGRGGNKIDTVPALQWWLNREIERRAPDAAGGRTLDSESLRLKSEQADKVQIENEIARGTLIHVDQVKEVNFAAATKLAGALRGLPARLAHQLASLSGEAAMQEVIRDEIGRVANQFADDLRTMAGSMAETAPE